MKSFKQFIVEGDRIDALKQAVKMHSRTQRGWVHNNEKNPLKRAKKNLEYYGGYVASAGVMGLAAASAAGPAHAGKGFLAAAGAAVAHPLYTHISQFKNEYGRVRAIQKREKE